MGQSFNNLDWKILLGICFVLLVVIGLMIFLSNRPNNTQDQSPIALTQVYQGANYTISHPSNITITPTSYGEAGNGLSFNLPQKTANFMDFEVTKSTPDNNMGILTKMYEVFDYSENNIHIGNVVGKEFTGSTTLKNRIIQEKTAIFEYQGYNYKLGLSYFSNQRDQQLDQLFSQILSSLKFK